MNGANVSRRVVKIGGSLFDDAEWIEHLRVWIASQPPATTLLVVGGGPAADAVAEQQKIHGFDDAEAHWRCIQAMSDHARDLCRRVPRWPLLSRFDVPALGAFSGRVVVVDSLGFMKDIDAKFGPRALPESWDVSSDSIAARITEVFAADELVLLKSTLPADVHNLGDFVDPYFAEAARRLPSIRFVNLRDPAFPEVRWR